MHREDTKPSADEVSACGDISHLQRQVKHVLSAMGFDDKMCDVLIFKHCIPGTKISVDAAVSACIEDMG